MSNRKNQLRLNFEINCLNGDDGFGDKSCTKLKCGTA